MGTLANELASTTKYGEYLMDILAIFHLSKIQPNWQARGTSLKYPKFMGETRTGATLPAVPLIKCHTCFFNHWQLSNNHVFKRVFFFDYPLASLNFRPISSSVPSSKQLEAKTEFEASTCTIWSSGVPQNQIFRIVMVCESNKRKIVPRH